MRGRKQTTASDSHCRLDNQTQKLLQQPKHRWLSQGKSACARSPCLLTLSLSRTHTLLIPARCSDAHEAMEGKEDREKKSGSD